MSTRNKTPTIIVNSQKENYEKEVWYLKSWYHTLTWMFSRELFWYCRNLQLLFWNFSRKIIIYHNSFKYFKYFHNIFFPEPQILIQATLRFIRQHEWWCFIQIYQIIEPYYIFVTSNFFQNLGLLQRWKFCIHICLTWQLNFFEDH